MAKKKRKSKRTRQSERGKVFIILGIIGILAWSFFGGDKMLSAKSDMENYVSAAIILSILGILTRGTYLIYKSIKR